MTDLEMTKLCAVAMGIDTRFLKEECDWQLVYDPLHDDAQAMALVKMLRLFISPRKTGDWCVFLDDKTLSFNTDLCRAIVECVAKMRAVKPNNKWSDRNEWSDRKLQSCGS